MQDTTTVNKISLEEDYLLKYRYYVTSAQCQKFLFYLKKEEDYKVHKPYDKYFKRIIDISGEGLLELIGFPIKIKHIHDSEKINEISGELHIDKLIYVHLLL